jgi:hypothetical protein
VIDLLAAQIFEPFREIVPEREAAKKRALREREKKIENFGRRETGLVFHVGENKAGRIGGREIRVKVPASDCVTFAVEAENETRFFSRRYA